MLVLTRHSGEVLRIGGNTTVTVLGSQDSQTRLDIAAPDDAAIHHSEIYQQIGSV